MQKNTEAPKAKIKVKKKDKMKTFLSVIGVISLITVSIMLFLHFNQKPEENIVLADSEKEEFKTLEKAKIISLDEVEGIINEKALKLVGFEETDRKYKKKIEDSHFQTVIEKSDGFVWRKTKSFYNGLNRRNVYANFSVDYGLGFDFQKILEEKSIKVDEENGIITIPKLKVQFIQFYIDPTYQVTEDNGSITKLFNRELSDKERNFLIKRMEKSIKKDIVKKKEKEAQKATEKQVKKLFESINRDIKVEFE